MTTTLSCHFLNRHELKIAVTVEIPAASKGLMFVMHGMKGFKEQAHIAALAATALARDLTVVRFDTTHSIGDSGGDVAQSTITAAATDLADVVAWSARQPWFQRPFVMAGHSMGSIATLEYARTHLADIKALGLLATVVTGRLTYEAALTADPDMIADWRAKGYREDVITARGGLKVRIPWSHMEDRLQYDALEYAATLKMPVFISVGSADKVCPPAHQRLFYDALGSQRKKLHILQGAGHTYHEPAHLAELQNEFGSWLAMVI